MRKELLEGLTEEQINKLRDCKTPEEALALAKEEGIELTEEQIKNLTDSLAEVTKDSKLQQENHAKAVKLAEETLANHLDEINAVHVDIFTSGKFIVLEVDTKHCHGNL